MNQEVNFGINFTVNGQQVTAAVSGIGAGMERIDRGVSSIGRQIKALNFNAVVQQINGVADGLNSLATPGAALSNNLYELQAMTGVAGAKLQEIEGYARDASKEFGTSAVDNIESYKLILSQLDPVIAKTPVALKAMGESVAVTSKLLAGDSVAATELLTTAMNQYGVSTEDPIQASKVMAQMMNVMASAAQAGSAELPQIKSALEQAGMAASAAGVSFEETNAAIQVLDKAGKKGSEGGVALRNVLATLGEGRFLPKEVTEELKKAGVNIAKMGDQSIPLQQRLATLTPILKDGALVTKLFGKENSNAALALLQNQDLLKEYTDAVTGTSAATEQAAIIMESPAEKAARLQAQVDDLKISIFNGTDGWLGYAGVLGDTTQDLTNLWPAVGMVSKVLGINTIATALQASASDIASGATSRWAVIQAAFNTTLWASPITWVVAAIAALVAGAIYAYNHFEKFRGFIWAAWEAIKGFGQILYDLTVGHIVNLVKGIGGIGTALVELFSGNFTEVADAAKNAMMDISGVSTARAVYDSGKKMADATAQGYEDGISDFRGEAMGEAAKTGTKVGDLGGLSLKDAFVKQVGEGAKTQLAIAKAIDPEATMQKVLLKYYEMGANAAQQIADGLIDGIAAVAGAAAQVASAAMGAFAPMTGMMASMGVKAAVSSTPTAPGAIALGGKPGGGGGGGTSDNKKKHAKTNEAIATGGTRNTTVNVHIGKQIEKIVIEGGNVAGGLDNLKEVVLDEMTRVFAMAASMSGV